MIAPARAPCDPQAACGLPQRDEGAGVRTFRTAVPVATVARPGGHAVRGLVCYLFAAIWDFAANRRRPWPNSGPIGSPAFLNRLVRFRRSSDSRQRVALDNSRLSSANPVAGHWFAPRSGGTMAIAQPSRLHAKLCVPRWDQGALLGDGRTEGWKNRTTSCRAGVG